MSEWKDAYIRIALDDEAAPDLSDRILKKIGKDQPRRALQIAASIIFFVAALAGIFLLPGGDSTPPIVAEAIKALDDESAQIALTAEQDLVDMGEDVVSHLEKAGARRVIDRIRWQKTILTKKEVFDRLRTFRVTREMLPREYRGPMEIFAVLSKKTGTPYLLQRMYTKPSKALTFPWTEEESAYTVIRKLCGQFGLEMKIIDGGVYLGGQGLDERRVAGTLLETIQVKNERRRVTAAGMLIRIAGQDYGFNPYGSPEKRRASAARIVRWWRNR